MTINIENVNNYIRNQKYDDLTQFKLNIDAYRLHLRHKFDPVSVVAIGKIDPLPHQIEAFVKMLGMLRPQSGIEGRIRMLLADDVGLGKTIVVGLITKELLLRKKVKRVLIVCPSGLQIQWKEEMEEKFNEEFEIIRGNIEGNPYIETNKAIISVDTGRNLEKRDLLMQSNWDIIIFDEAHKLRPGSMRYELGFDLSKRTKHLILASATPHDGKIENFIGLVKLVDDEIENNTQGELKKYLEPLMIRRLKEEIVNFKGKKIFPKREIPVTSNVSYTDDEKYFYDLVEDYVKTYYRKAEETGLTTAILALYILHRRVSSSIEAGVQSLKKRKIRLLEPFIDFEANQQTNYLDYLDDNDEEKKEQAEEILLGATASTGEDLKNELKELDSLIQIGENLLENNNDSKYSKLRELVQNIRKEQPDDKIIIFTEFTDTLRFLERKLTKEEKLLVSKIQGGMDIQEKKQQSLMFESSSDILLGTEAAGEGLNLQFANIVINYELPWNPNRLEQRIGRVYRYGQKKKVYIHNFKTAFPIDNAVLNKIQEKMENIREIFGNGAIDVIGMLISEKEILEIFKKARETGSGIDQIDEFLEEKIQILKEIDQFLIKKRFNLTEVKSQTRDLKQCINNFDIERFLLSYLQFNEKASYIPQSDNKYHISISPLNLKNQPDCTETETETETFSEEFFEISGTFDKNKKGKYISLGHPALECALHDAMMKNSFSLISSEEEGVIASYILKFFNGMNQEIYAEPIIIKKSQEETAIIDPHLIWEYKESKNTSNIVVKEKYIPLIQEIIANPKPIVLNKIDNIENFVKNKNEKELVTEYNYIFSEYDWKIKNLNLKKRIHLEKGQNYLISGLEKRITQLRQELHELIGNVEKSKQISWELCGPIDIALLIPHAIKIEEKDIKPHEKGMNLEEIAKLREKIETIGMRDAMKYEEEHGRKPEDVSHEFYRGYDILSKSKNETRHIEVKALAKTISKHYPVQISSNEWRTASQIREEYYLYIVENALTKPTLKPIFDPYENLEKYIKKVPIEDYKMVLDNFPKEVNLHS